MIDQKWSAFLLILLLASCTGKKAGKEKEDPPLVNPPIKEADVPQKEFQVDAGTDTTLTYEKSGTELHIPAGSFVNGDGEVVKGEVELSYREFHTPADIYAAGVPTTYSPDGEKEMVFESYGMMELRASKDGEALSKADDKEVRADMRSLRKGNSDLFYLDEKSGEWQKYGTDSVASTTKEEEREALPETPMPPTLASGNHIEIKSGMEIKKPEGYRHSTHLFEPVNPKSCDPPKRVERVRISYGQRPGTYRVEFSHPSLENVMVDTCVCQPAYRNKGEAFKKALKRYREKYSEELQESERLREAFNQRWSDYGEFRKRQLSMGDSADRSQLRESILKNQVFASNEERLSRSFELQGFGYTNCDRLQKIPEVAELEATFEEEGTGKSLELHDVAIAEIPSNSLMRMSGGSIRFDPSTENLLWGITQDDRLAYMKPERMGKISKKQGAYTFKMKVISEKLGSYEKIKEVLF